MLTVNRLSYLGGSAMFVITWSFVVSPATLTAGAEYQNNACMM